MTVTTVTQPRRRRPARPVRLPAAVRPLAAQLRVVRGGVLVHLDHHRDLHHVRLRAGHRRPAEHLDLAHRGGRPGPGGAGLRRAGRPGAAVRLLLPVGLPAGERARRLVAGLDVVRVPVHRHRVGGLRPGPGGVPAADRRGVHADQRGAGDAGGAGPPGGADHRIHPGHHPGQQHRGGHRGDRHRRPDRAAHRRGRDPGPGALVQPDLHRDGPARRVLRLARPVHAGHAARRVHHRGLRVGQQPGRGDASSRTGPSRGR